ncbi:MAG TPA: dienelactone hydrolase family protein [Nitrospirota bacterium]|nr:dienelactone hydrolase family protein [Nitrospirota bacterium]
MVEDWLANAYKDMSQRQFLSWTSAAGINLAGFARASSSVAGEVITTSTQDLVTVDGSVLYEALQVPIYEAWPAGAGKYPILLVIPEIFGMHEHIKDVTRRFAKEGFLSITFEPYAREGGVLHLPDIPSVRKITDSVPDKRVMADLDAIVAYAKEHPAARSDRIGITGFCRGGMYTLLYAAHNQELKAAVAWYGQIKPEKKPGVRTVSPLDVAAKIKMPLLGLYGEEDLGIPPTDVKEMEVAIRASGGIAEFIIFAGAPHAFFADYRPSYRSDAAKEGWNRCLAWFSKYLKT